MKFLAFEKSVGAVVFRRQDEEVLYLLLRYRSWQWDFPKGHMEKGESEEQTLRREILEETGISKISIFSNFRKSVWYFYQAKNNEKRERIEKNKGINIFKKVVLYCVETKDSKVKIDFENKDFIWLPFEQACKKISNANSRKILTKVNREIFKRSIP